VYLNGKKQTEPYAYHDPDAAYDPFLYNFPPANRDQLLFSMQAEWSQQIFQYVHDGEIVVPPDNYFAMGDNRDHSWDSRYWGFVNREAIMGGPVVIYWSVVTAEDDDTEAPPSPGAALKDMFDTLIHLPTRTRWKRMFRTVH
jgi:signal peptidase I